MHTHTHTHTHRHTDLTILEVSVEMRNSTYRASGGGIQAILTYLREQKSMANSVKLSKKKKIFDITGFHYGG